MITQTIPVLDLQAFRSSDRSRFVAELGEALETIGFFALVNHGVDADLIHAAYTVAQAFFELPETVKRRYEVPMLNGQRGFTRFGREHAKDHPVPDLKEFWQVGRSHPLASHYPANPTPVEVPDFAPVMTRLYAQLDTCAIELLQACALYLGESETLLSDMAADGDTILRIIHYPPIPADAQPDSVRSAPHEDINLITLLCEASDDGLELRRHDGTWSPIHAVPGQIIVDSGDMLQQLTNGLLKSTTHRVVNPPNQHLGGATQNEQRRFSMPFFVHPRAEVDLTPLSGCVTRTRTPPLPTITAGAYLQQRLQEIGLSSRKSVNACETVSSP